MAWRQKQDGRAVGTFVIDRRFKGVGRIRKSSGTSDRRTFDQINFCLTELWNTGRLDILIRLRDSIVAPLAVYDAFRHHQLDSLRSPDDIPHLLPGGDVEKSPVIAWVTSYQMADTTRTAYNACLRLLLKYANATCTIGDLPRLLRKMRADYADRPRTFNQTRSVLQAYANKTQEKHSVLWNEIRKVPTLTYKVAREGNPLGIREVWELVNKAGSLDAVKMIWTLALTGMRQREYYVNGFELDEKEDRILIHGEKNDQSERTIPLVDPSLMGPPTMDYKTFLHVLKRLSRREVKPYDLRRTFARLMEEAGIIESHQMVYMGHAPQNMTGRYKKPRISHAMRVEDGRKIRAYLKKELPNRVDLATAHRFFDLTA